MANIKRIATVALGSGPAWNDQRQDLEQRAVLDYIAEAGSLGADILLFQEAFGFVEADLDSHADRRRFAPGVPTRAPTSRTTYAELAISLDDPYVRRARQAAEEPQVNVILPIVERSGDEVYNSLVPMSRDGRILRPYRKMHPVPQGEEARPGVDNAAQKIAGVPVSFAICFDIHFDDVVGLARLVPARAECLHVAP